MANRSSTRRALARGTTTLPPRRSSSDGITALKFVRSLGMAAGVDASREAASAVVATLEARLAPYEDRLVDQDRRMELQARQRGELARTEAELRAARAEVALLRKAVPV